MILTVDQCRAYVSTSLTDDALLDLLIAAERDIVAVAGSGALTEYQRGGYSKLVCDHPVGTVTSVTERADTASTVLLSSDDYRIDGHILVRLDTGTNPRSYWLGLVKVIYTSTIKSEELSRAQADLIRLELTRTSGVTSERIGDYAVGYSSASAYAEQKASILAALTPPLVR